MCFTFTNYIFLYIFIYFIIVNNKFEIFLKNQIPDSNFKCEKLKAQ